MRQIVLDTETTGLDVDEGHRIVEVAGIELFHRVETGKEFHQFVNPGREIEDEALHVHGITAEFLESKQPFSAIAEEFLDFIKGADLIIHNASFDVTHLNNELKIAFGELVLVENHCNSIIDTLQLARSLRPGRRASLDALATNYGVDLSVREKHGAMIDARILLTVWKEMTGGQTAMNFGEGGIAGLDTDTEESFARFDGMQLPVLHATPEELKLHENWLEYLDEQSEDGCLWLKLEQTSENREVSE